MILKLVFVVAIIAWCARTQDEPFVSNLNDRCVRCLCVAATGCNETLGCNKGYCGAFKISRLFWIDAGRITLPEDDPERAGAFEDCTINYSCSRRMVKNYLANFAKDCNGDGIVNCEDYAKIHFNGAWQCEPPLDRNEAGRNFTKRFRDCISQ